MAVYVVLVSVIFQRGGPDYPLFLLAAILPWKWFQTSIQDGITSVSGAERLVRQIKFPKLVLPVAAVMAGIVNFAFGLIPLFALMLLFFRDRIELTLLLIPAVAAVQLVFNLALTILLAAVNVFYRDVGNIARHVLRFWFYLSPTLYSIDDVQKIAGTNKLIEIWYQLNPFTHILGSYRSLIYYGQAPDWVGLGAVGIVSIGLLALAILLFKRVEPQFAKIL